MAIQKDGCAYGWSRQLYRLCPSYDSFQEYVDPSESEIALM
jgi:hypothetical protein